MTVDRDQLKRIRTMAIKAGLVVRDADLDEFVRSYQPTVCQGLTLPPSYCWLCALCEPAELQRIWMLSPREADAGSFVQENEDLARNGYELDSGPIPWPKDLLAFANTCDEFFCFAYGTPDSEPAIVDVDHYRNPPAEEEAPQLHWDWLNANFEEWLVVHAKWRAETDAKNREWRKQD